MNETASTSSRNHPRAFAVSVVWTLFLLFLGSVVHATGSSLACPDWPTCYGTMVPEMSGGVFWEHLHRLVAGGLLLMWILATWFAYRETSKDSPVFKGALAGVVLLLIQSLFGGITVLLKLPAWVSTTHLALALTFLVLATVLASATGWARTPTPDPSSRRWAVAGGIFVFVQSVLGALVRHTDSGLMCPDAPLCLGRVIPPLGDPHIAIHFAHRAVGILAALVVIAFAFQATRTRAPRQVRVLASWAALLILVQVTLGFLSVLTRLAVVPVSLHTLFAAGLLAMLTHLATATRDGSPTPAGA
ncbi:MAG: heme A synthase [Gemmatimonadota bacterium]